MNGSSFECGTTRATAAAGTNWILSNERFKFWRCIISNDTPQHLAIEAEDKSPIGSTKPYRTFGNGFEDRLQIERRPTDDLKHIGGGSLLLKGFTQLVEQSRVLDGDDGLGGKILYQVDLLIREGENFLAINANHTDHLVVLQHRNAEQSSCPRKLDQSLARLVSVCWRGCYVGHLGGFLRPQYLPESYPWIRVENILATHIVGIGLGCAMSCAYAEAVSFTQPEIAESGPANSHCVRQHGFKYRLQLAG